MAIVVLHSVTELLQHGSHTKLKVLNTSDALPKPISLSLLGK